MLARREVSSRGAAVRALRFCFPHRFAANPGSVAAKSATITAPDRPAANSKATYTARWQVTDRDQAILLDCWAPCDTRAPRRTSSMEPVSLGSASPRQATC
jgi:hypothetical protein